MQQSKHTSVARKGNANGARFGNTMWMPVLRWGRLDECLLPAQVKTWACMNKGEQKSLRDM